MKYLQTIFQFIGDMTWGWSLIPFLIVLGAFFTLASGFVQFRFFGRMFRMLFPGQSLPAEGHVSSREALLISVGGRVGGGNIAGVAVAITLGGPGAVFWMWVVALVGMATSFFECTLAQLYKRAEGDGTYRGGPAQYILHGLGPQYKWLATAYAISLIAVFALGFNAFQGNTVAAAAQDSLGLSRIWTGIGLAILTGFVVYGGIKRIAQAADVVVPIMAAGYIGMALVVIALNITHVPAMMVTIVKNAFGFEAVVSGGVGAAIANGVRRGLFSNEAGLGSAPNVAAVAYARHPVSQGIVQSLSVFIDTVVICSCTAFVILLGNVYVPGVEGVDGVALTQQSLSSHVGAWSQYFLTGATLLFAFSSIIYNYYLGENALTVFTERTEPRHALRILIIGVIFVGSSAPKATEVFFFSDPVMGILALINLLAMTMLFPIGMRVLKDYKDQLKQGKEHPVFEPAKFADLDIDLDAWKFDPTPAPAPEKAADEGREVVNRT
ncbi:alanine/glycine:cation symporter family protein [Polyangium spumosum]|uniref:Amino acid carrier protein n=1 Tax=Polyangium spumosum TaxID=889282 RepID=A0A6N7Q4B3_9BACT|nr:alanine/glycine:cation symporter family protein [Polyangium spumosum]MRG97515.1 amino acid carrier protein [Polyangium spumosum]